MSNGHPLEVRIAGIAYEGWASVHVVRTMDALAGSYTLTRRDVDSSVAQAIRMGDEITISWAGNRLITGWVEHLRMIYGQATLAFQITGRDKTGDLVDCSYATTPNEWKAQTISVLLQNLAAQNGTAVEIDPAVSATLNVRADSFKADESETVYDLIARLCRDNGVLALSRGDGKLFITKATTTDFSNLSLELGVNIRSASFVSSDQTRFSTYEVKGSGIGTDAKALTDFVTCYGKATDSVVRRSRPLVIFPEEATTNGQALVRATWEMNLRAGHSRKLYYEVGPLDRKDGSIWKINQLVRVKDQTARVEDARIVSTVDWFFSNDRGQETRLELVDPKTYSLEGKAIKGRWDR